MSRHLAVCRTNTGAGWAVLEMDGELPHVANATTASLVSVIDNVIKDVARAPHSIEFSFVDRPLAEVLEGGVQFPKTPADMARVSDASIQILAKENAEPRDDLYVPMWRDPQGGLTCVGKVGRLRAVHICECLHELFRAANYASFGAVHPSETTSFNRVQRFAYPRMIILRHGIDWAARALCPSAYPGDTAEQLKAKQDAAAKEYEERRLSKDPKEVARRRQEHWKLERELLAANNWCSKFQRQLAGVEAGTDQDAVAELRTELEAWKVKQRELSQRVKSVGGLTPVAKIDPTPPPPVEKIPLREIQGGGWVQADEAAEA